MYGGWIWWLLVFLCARTTADDWPVYLGDKGARQYSQLDQITPGNVAKLEVAWTYRCGDALENNRSQIQCNPLVIDGVIYATSPGKKVIALDAVTGREIWKLDLFGGKEGGAPGVNRGLAYWSKGGERRLLFAATHFLYAIDAKSGKLIGTFGERGKVNLKKDLGREADKLALNVTSPGVVFEDLFIMGMRVGEGPAPAAPGPIRAYDVRSGKLVWTFRTIPHPGEVGYETWPPDAWQRIGGANSWAGMAVDGKRGIVFCPTGSASFDFWGGNRIGENLFANCLIALDARSGKRLWHYQFVRHDLWDRDLPSIPTLLTVERGGKRIDAVAQTTKSGHVFVFNRETGEPLFPIEEVAVPPSDLQGESAWKSQPLPVKPEPFARQVFSYDQITDVSPEEHREVLERFRQLRPHTPFMPPSEEGTIIFPGFDGGAEWGGAALDPEGIMYVNANEMPWILTMVKTKAKGGQAMQSGETIYTQICAACHGMDRAGNKAAGVASLIDIGKRLKREEALKTVETGRGVMPSFAFLSVGQRERVIDYLFGISSGRGGKGGGEENGDVSFGQIPYTHTGYTRWLTSKGYPAVKPPWGTLNAIDLNTGEFKWRVPLGEISELTDRGIPKTGTENYGGPAVTAGGLIFIAASKDEHIRAFDKTTGEELWKARLPAGGYATPAVYAVGGRQFVVIACGGGKMATKSGDAYVAFALPESL